MRNMKKMTKEQMEDWGRQEAEAEREYNEQGDKR